MKWPRKTIAEKLNLPFWLVEHWPRRNGFVQAMLESKGVDDAALQRQIYLVLLAERWCRAIAPYLAIFRLLKEVARGRYWGTAKEVHGGTAQASGSSPGAVGIAAANWTVTGNPAPASFGGTFEDAGVRAGEVVAYRCWLLKDGLLHSAYQNKFVWEPGKVVEGDPSKPSEGVHGFKDRHSATSYIHSYELDGSAVVSGTVELWGDVYEHTRGYRASKAAVASIDDSPNYDAAALRRKYKLGRKKKK